MLIVAEFNPQLILTMVRLYIIKIGLATGQIRNALEALKQLVRTNPRCLGALSLLLFSNTVPPTHLHCVGSMLPFSSI